MQEVGSNAACCCLQDLRVVGRAVKVKMSCQSGLNLLVQLMLKGSNGMTMNEGTS